MNSHAGEEGGDAADASQVSLSLYAQGGSVSLQLTNGKFTIHVPFSAGKDDTWGGECLYWHEEHKNWSSDGCTNVGVTNQALICECMSPMFSSPLLSFLWRVFCEIPLFGFDSCSLLPHVMKVRHSFDDLHPNHPNIPQARI